jgi:acyl-CoA reductase-like NAD-dependent aldehyde dehydrogenase
LLDERTIWDADGLVKTHCDDPENRECAMAVLDDASGVLINDTSSCHADAMPYGGVKDSGYGLEGPRYAVPDMTDPRIIVLNLGASR